MRILKLLSRFIICILCTSCLCNVSIAASNLPTGDVGEYGNFLTHDNISVFNENLAKDFDKFEPKIDLNPTTFVPIEAKIGLMLMKALSAVDDVLQSSLVRFTVIFLLIMYAFWIGLEAYKLIRDSGDYKTALYNIFKQGITIAIWIIILNYGPTKIFAMIVSPILTLGTYLSDFILGAVAETYKVNIPDTCAAIQNYVHTDKSLNLLVDADTAANIMCLPARASVFFYHATATGFQWIKSGLGTSPIMIALGIVSVVIFIKCIFKYAFMTLGIVVSLFLTLLMLPFTALAESMPSSSEKNFAGQFFNGLLKIFNTQKLSNIIGKFINATIYFVSLSIIIAICATLLTNIVSLGADNQYTTGSAMTIILSGCLVLYLANQTEKLTKDIGGDIDNSFGKQMEGNAKILWADVKKIGNSLFKAWLKK